MTADTETTRLTEGQVEEAGGVLARAFYSDPFSVHLLPDASTRMPGLTWLMERCARYAHLYGEVYATQELKAVLLCLTPNSPPMNRWRFIRAGMAFPPRRLERGPREWVSRVVRRMGPLHSRDAPERHWYLWFLGVEPEVQRRGCGSTLLRAVLRRGDEERMPCQLETLSPENVRLYERHGFEVVGEGDMLDGGPHYWRMKRLPQR